MANTRHLRNTIGLFVIVGIGLGLSGYIALDFMQTSIVDNAQSEFMASLGELFLVVVALQTSFITFLLGSIVATATGLGSAKGFPSAREAAIHNGAAAAVGFPLMVGVAIVLMLFALGGGGGGEAAANGTATATPTTPASGGGGGIGEYVDVGGLVIRVIGLCIPTALVGAGAGWVGFEFGN